jgi:two-component system sensor histidine kinase SenX3
VESQLVTALRNLLTNAINYSPRGTAVLLNRQLTNGVLEISVADQGMGIPENELHRVFERFYRVDQARSRVTGGTGLGLSIVKHVAENHGGEVGVWSVLGEGSTFTVRLPAYSGAGPLSDPQTRTTSEAPSSPTPSSPEPLTEETTA